MNLVAAQDDNEGPGLWSDPAWKQGTEGTFAVIIGVSSYRHLDDGIAVADDLGQPWIAEARGLGQLYVSALTAFRIFTWLAGQYRHEAPLAKCWLLLAPTAAERTYLTVGSKYARHAEPTFENCRSAIGWWSRTMRQLPSAVAAKSRGFFFFSGHGLECTRDQQLLLPSDYLHPPNPTINEAISTRNLTLGLGSQLVREQLFFVDACRNDHVQFRGKRIVGADILNEEEAAAGSPDVVTPVLYATGPGLRSFQHRDPAKGVSIYGEALLDGLAGQPNIALKAAGNRYRVELSPLEQYVRARVIQLLKAAGSTERQNVRLGGSSETDMNVTYVDRAATAASPGTRPPPNVSDHNALDEAPPPPALEAIRAATPVREFSATRRFSPRWLTDWNEAHRIFGSETVTRLWREHARVWLLGKRKWRRSDGIHIAEVARDEHRGHYRLRLKIKENDPIGYWLQLTDEQGGVHACMLPRDPQIDAKPQDPVFEVSYDRSPGLPGTSRAIVRLEGELGTQGGALGKVGDRWRLYSTEDVASALDAIDAAELKNLLEKKRGSPLSAVVAVLILLRANKLDQLPVVWVRNLANWFPALPDGAVLYAELLLRRRGKGLDRSEAVLTEAAETLLLVTKRGIPRTSEAFEYGAALAGRLKDRKELSPGLRKKLGELDRRFGNAFDAYRTGGLFCNFSGLSADMDPDRLWRHGLANEELTLPEKVDSREEASLPLRRVHDGKEEDEETVIG